MTTSNPLGATVVFDGENPRTFTAQADEVISGGHYVVCSGINAVVGSGLSSYADGDIKVVLVTDPEKANGIALNTVAANGYVTVATRGAYLVKCGGSFIPGTKAELVDHEYAQSLTSGIVPSALFADVPGNKPVGRVMTAAKSGAGAFREYGLVYFNF